MPAYAAGRPSPRKRAALRPVKQSKSLEDTAAQLRETRREVGYMEKQTISQKGEKPKSITLGGRGDTFGITGAGTRPRKRP